MRKYFKITLLALASLSMLAVQSCRKPAKPKEPCSNPRMVTALSSEHYDRGHFEIEEQGALTWLYATNWSQYASKVTPGQQYKISYKEVKCPDDNCKGNSIKEGGCVVYPRKCIVITCLEPVRQSESCLNSEITDMWTKEYPGTILSTSGITGDKLHAELTFSGCSESDYKRFKLVMTEMKLGANIGPIFMAKAVDTNNGVTCMAVFSHKACFDISVIKSYFKQQNRPLPQSVIIRLLVAGGEQDLTYKL